MMTFQLGLAFLVGGILAIIFTVKYYKETYEFDDSLDDDEEYDLARDINNRLKNMKDEDDE